MAQQREYLEAMQDPAFWQGLGLAGTEDMRLRLRGLVPFLDKRQRKIVYTDFQDEVRGVQTDDVVAMPKMTGVQYEKKAPDFLRNYLTHIAI